MTSPKVSVVVGYYNRRDVLEMTLDSILDQSFKNIELVVFDDASTDGTSELLAEYVARRDDNRLRVIRHETNVGFVHGLIDAIEICSGEYIAIQGSGDVSRSDRIRRQVEVLDQDIDVGVVGCWYQNIKDHTGHRKEVRPDADSASSEDLLVRNYFTHGEVMFRRATYDLVGGYRAEFTYVQDLDLWIRMRKKAAFATVPEVLYERHIRSDGVTSNPRKFAKQVRYPVLARELAGMSDAEQEECLAKVREHGVESVVPLVHSTVQKKYIEQIKVLGWGGDAAEAVSLARESIVSPYHRSALVTFFFLYDLPVVGRMLHGIIAVLRGLKRVKVSR